MKQFSLALMGVAAFGISASAENRSYDGYRNNLGQPAWGAAFTPLLRLGPASYSDGISAPAGADRPNPRTISNRVVAQIGLMPNGGDFTDWTWQWGQFLDHDISLSEFMVPTEPFNIPVPTGDLFFDPQGTGLQFIRLDRTVYDLSTGTEPGNPRQQVNQLTSFIDASNVYGSDADRALWLRTMEGGKLKTSSGNLLPFSDGTQGNAGPGGLPSLATDLFTAGDIRANEQVGLASVHTLFVREHNRRCDILAAEHPGWNDERLYQRARKEVGALMQVITYFEFLPVLLGPNAPDARKAEYDPAISPAIANEFANAVYRLGHTMLSPEIMRVDEDGAEMPEGHLPLRDAFFQPMRLVDEGGIEPVLRGLAKKRMQNFDTRVIDDVRNFLFGAPGQGGFDLPSLNIQRGRDHGLPDYNTMRQVMGLGRVNDFDEISTDPVVQEALRDAFGDVDKIDLWVGGLAEDPLPGALTGELITAVMVNQFTRLRDGDRFFYRFDPAFTDADVAELEATRLSDVIRWNTPIEKIQDDVFRMVEESTAQPPGTVLCGTLPLPMLGAIFLGLVGMRRRRAVGELI